jgi:small subunit ribosomal protein S16
VSVKIRLMRVGKKKQPTYRVVVADERSPRDGRIIETIGHYGPRHDPSLVDINGERALDWLRKGAQPTEQVQKLLTVSGVWATFESEKSGKIVTKLNRRGFATGKVTTTKGKKKGGDATADAPAAKAAKTEAAEPGAPEADAAEAEEPKADAPAPDSPEPEAPAAEPEAEAAEVAAGDAAPQEAAE